MKKIPLLTIAIFLLLSATASASSTSELISEGNKLWSENKMDKAQASFQKAIDQDPKSAKAYARLGALLLMQNKGKESINAYQSAITHEPDNAKSFAALSIAYLHMGRHRMAQTMAERAFELDPSMSNAKSISEYIDAKLKMLASAKAAGTSQHAPMMPFTSMDEHDQKASH